MPIHPAVIFTLKIIVASFGYIFVRNVIRVINDILAFSIIYIIFHIIFGTQINLDIRIVLVANCRHIVDGPLVSSRCNILGPAASIRLEGLNALENVRLVSQCNIDVHAVVAFSGIVIKIAGDDPRIAIQSRFPVRVARITRVSR